MKASSIHDRLQAVDISSLDRLLAIRGEKRRIDEYRARAEALKSNVTEAVHARVMDDYSKRSAALERESAPLEAQARSEYDKVRALVDEVGRARERARLEKEELEFRHAIGEFDQAQLAERLKMPQQILDQCQTEQALLNEQAARFAAALGEDVNQFASELPPKAEAAPPAGGRAAPAPAPPPSTPEIVAAAPAASAQPALAASAQPASTASAQPPANGSKEEQQPPPPDRTMVVPEPPPLASPQEIEPAKSAAEPKRNTAVPPAVLLITDSSAGQIEFRLGQTNGIGRSNENRIQIVKPGVSRLHAVITARGGAFLVEDLSSENGTFVNGERVGERQLTDGDTIEIGTVRFVFRTPWPVPGVAAAGRPAG